MICIGETPPPLALALLERYRRITPPAMGHHVEGGIMDAALKPLQSNVAIAGPAVTVQCLGRDSAVCYKAIDLLRPGDVLVIDRSGDRRYACWGFEREEAADARFRDDLVAGNSASEVLDIDALIAANSNH